MANLEDKSFLNCATNIIAGAVVGGASSLVHPYAIPKMMRNVKDGEADSYEGSCFYAANYYGYAIGLGLWVTHLLEHPEQPLSYVPVLTNIASGLIQYRQEKKKKERVKRDSWIERVDEDLERPSAEREAI